MNDSETMVRLSMADLPWATEVLTDAFVNEAPVNQLFAGPRHRAQVEYFMRCSAAYALLFGECYTSPRRDGVALWLVPGATEMTLGRMRKAGMLSAPFRLGLRAFGRFMHFAEVTDVMHKAAAPDPHYYLFALGVRRNAQGQGVGRHLVAGMLEKIDRESRPAYLETQNERNVRLYESLGFEVAAQKPFAKLDGLSNFGMLRAARV